MTYPATAFTDADQSTCTSNNGRLMRPDDRARGILVCIPSRGRPHKLGNMLRQCMATSEPSTLFYVALDSDDPQLLAYASYRELYAMTGRVRWIVGERASLSSWTNTLAALSMGQFRYLMSMGDDHMPAMAGWDSALIAAIRRRGKTGFAWAHDPLTTTTLGTAFMVAYDIVHALGWLMQPTMAHYWVDNVWAYLAELTTAGAPAPDALIGHRHYMTGLAERDQTYEDAEQTQIRDHGAYLTWQRERAQADAETIRRLLV